MAIDVIGTSVRVLLEVIDPNSRPNVNRTLLKPIPNVQSQRISILLYWTCEHLWCFLFAHREISVFLKQIIRKCRDCGNFLPFLAGFIHYGQFIKMQIFISGIFSRLYRFQSRMLETVCVGDVTVTLLSTIFGHEIFFKFSVDNANGTTLSFNSISKNNTLYEFYSLKKASS